MEVSIEISNILEGCSKEQLLYMLERKTTVPITDEVLQVINWTDVDSDDSVTIDVTVSAEECVGIVKEAHQDYVIDSGEAHEIISILNHNDSDGLEDLTKTLSVRIVDKKDAIHKKVCDFFGLGHFTERDILIEKFKELF